jgi:pilus assembly protein CpaE
MPGNEQRLRTVIITSPDRMDQEWIGRLMGSGEVEIIERVGLTSYGVELAQQQRPDLVVIDRGDTAQVESTMRQILAVSPMTLCIAIVPDLDVPTLRRLMATGARDVLPTPVVYTELISSIRRIIATEGDRPRMDPVLPAGTSSAVSGAMPELGKQRGKLVVVIAPKGGVGTTTLATNLAVSLHQVTRRKVALVDFSLQFGDVGVHLNLWSKYSITDLATRTEDIDDATIQRVMNQHDSGIHVLLAPQEPDVAAEISSVEVNSILDHLLDRYAYVIADTWSFLDEVAETLLNHADEVLLVTTPELPTLKNAKRFLEFAQRQELASGRFTIVLNRFPSIEGISLEDVQQHLHHPVGANIPSEGQLVTYSINKGIPLVISHPRSWTAQNIMKLAGKLAGDQVNTITLTAEEARRASDSESGTRLAKGVFKRFARKTT